MRALAAIVATGGLAVLAAGCGASSAGHVAQLGSTTTAARATGGASSSGSAVGQAIAYADCLRAHGVQNWPDPNSSGVFDKAKLTLGQLGVSGHRLQAAEVACRHLLPNGDQPPDQAQILRVKALGLAFARCVRSHGLPSFPDPGSDGRIPDPGSVGIGQGSPKFQAANRACGKYRPPYMPSNSAYNAWARTQG